MRSLNRLLGTSPLMVRVAPFVVFLVLTSCQGRFGAASAYWFYLAKTLVAVWLIREMRPLVSEMRWAISWEALVVGVGVFGLWIGLDPFYPKLPEIITKLGLSKFFGTHQAIWNPHEQFGQNSALAWLMIVTRILGSTLVVPPLEEVFYRSFLYRYVAKPDFLSVPLNRFLPLPFLVTAAVFGISHSQWLAGILCGMAYQWLVLRRNRLGDAMTAHAITNFLLGVWVAWQGAWQFW
ncbi:MAG: CAAX prenyl protease-related protein [Verrucomicrobiota bacterium]